MYALADRLGKSASEVLQFPAEERAGWIAYVSHLDKRAQVEERLRKLNG